MARKPKTPITETPTPQEPQGPTTATAIQFGVAEEPTAAALVTEKIIGLKKSTREYAHELCTYCPPSSHAALLAKLEHVRANAELAIRG